MKSERIRLVTAVGAAALSVVFALGTLSYVSASSRQTARSSPSRRGTAASSAVGGLSSAAPSASRAGQAEKETRNQGEQKTKKELNTQNAQNKQNAQNAQNKQNKQNTRKPADLSSLSSRKIGWGLGAARDDLGRPTDAVQAQAKYGALGGNFLVTEPLQDGASAQPTERKVLCLTFDEGYENGYTAAILDTLREKNVKAVFFITGDYARREGALVRRMIDEGHTVGNHTWKHYSMPEKSADTCREELRSLHDYVKEQFGVEMHVMRPPKGEFSEQTLALASEMGYASYLWSFAYQDWNPDRQSDPDASLQKLTERLHPGAIYLLHAVSSTNASILGDFIDRAQAAGYTFVLPAA